MSLRILRDTLLAPLAVACALCLGCGSGSDPAPASASGAAGGYVECVVPRPEMCARDWRPVCGLRDTGMRCVTTPCPSWETKTYGNACAACADPAVYGWRPDECELEGVVEDG